jgi:hypothetical protein
MTLVPTEQPRPLTLAERQMAQSVFGNSIDFSTVRVADSVGFGGAWWVTPPYAMGFPWFLMHMGELYYHANPNSPRFIHELTHVWQGQHLSPGSYVINSAAHQAWSIAQTGDVLLAYDIFDMDGAVQLQWREYSAEQQAMLVHTWFWSSFGNRSLFDWRYRYISANIRTGDPLADSSPVPPPPITMHLRYRYAALPNVLFGNR